MNRQIIFTADGSATVNLVGTAQSFHSRFGALQESLHVFLDAGLKCFTHRDRVRVFEMGFGTGLNALLTGIFAEESKIEIFYETIEAFPLEQELIDGLNYDRIIPGAQPLFAQIHDCAWDKEVQLTDFFTLLKWNADLGTFRFEREFDLVYFDAFDPESQPESWTAAVFNRIYGSMSDGGILVTYSSKGSVRRAMEEAGLRVSKLTGPPHKKEIIRAVK